MANSVNFSKADLLYYASSYRASVDALKGNATPYPANREDEIDEVDSFIQRVKDHKCDNLNDMQSCERAVAAKDNKCSKAWTFGALGLVGAAIAGYAVPVLHTALGAATGPVAWGGVVAAFVATRISDNHQAAANSATRFANELQGYGDYATAHVPQPAPAPQPVLLNPGGLVDVK